jgi:predicted Rossmann fold flavoprotein
MAKVLIVGAGAAGLMAAGAAVRQGHQVTVLEHTDKPGQKILVTGKGRCNVTNDCTAEEFLHHVLTNPRFLFSSLGAFPPARTMELFESLGVELKVERGRRVFPVSDKAEEIRQALLRYAKRKKPGLPCAVSVCGGLPGKNTGPMPCWWPPAV